MNKNSSINIFGKMFESIGSNIGRKCSKTATLYQMKQ